MSDKHFVSINNLTLKLDDTVILQDINMNLNSGDRCLLIGLNGSGKTTLLRTMAGMHMKTSGDLFIDGKISFQDQWNGLCFLGESWNRSIAFSGHSIAFQADIKVKNMMKSLQEEYPERRNKLIEVLGINEEWRMHMVSSGQRRKVRLLLGLIKPFKIALLDEMTMDLDIITRKRFMDWLKYESVTNNATIIYATHIFDGLENWATHLAHIKYNGILKNIIKMKPQANILNLVSEKLYDDYVFLTNNNILEKEDGDGTKEEYRSKKSGPQGGYSSGRGVKLSI